MIAEYWIYLGELGMNQKGSLSDYIESSFLDLFRKLADVEVGPPDIATSFPKVKLFQMMLESLKYDVIYLSHGQWRQIWVGFYKELVKPPIENHVLIELARSCGMGAVWLSSLYGESAGSMKTRPSNDDEMKVIAGGGGESHTPIDQPPDVTADYDYFIDCINQISPKSRVERDALLVARLQVDLFESDISYQDLINKCCQTINKIFENNVDIDIGDDMESCRLAEQYYQIFLNLTKAMLTAFEKRVLTGISTTADGITYYVVKPLSSGVNNQSRLFPIFRDAFISFISPRYPEISLPERYPKELEPAFRDAHAKGPYDYTGAEIYPFYVSSYILYKEKSPFSIRLLDQAIEENKRKIINRDFGSAVGNYGSYCAIWDLLNSDNDDEKKAAEELLNDIVLKAASGELEPQHSAAHIWAFILHCRTHGIAIDRKNYGHVVKFMESLPKDKRIDIYHKLYLLGFSRDLVI